MRRPSANWGATAVMVGLGGGVASPALTEPLAQTVVGLEGRVMIWSVDAAPTPATVAAFVRQKPRAAGASTADSAAAFARSVEGKIWEEAQTCASGPRRLTARIVVDHLRYDDRATSLFDGRGSDRMGGVVELVDPANRDQVIGRYRVDAVVGSGNWAARLADDRTRNLAEAFGRALCHAVFPTRSGADA